MPTLQNSPTIFISNCEGVLSVPSQSLKVHDDFCSLHQPLTPRSTCVVIFGELSVGKSAICQNFFANAVSHSKASSNGGNNFLEVKAKEVSELSGKHYIYERPVQVAEQQYNLKILDINTEKHLADSNEDGHIRYLKDYAAVGDALIVAYAVNDYESFQTAKYILSNVVGNITKPVVLVGNKSDLARQREVSKSKGIRLAEKYDTKFIETSALLNLNVDDLFEGIVNQVRLNKELKRKNSQNATAESSVWLDSEGSVEPEENASKINEHSSTEKSLKATKRRPRKYGRSNSSVTDWCRNKIKGIKKCEDLSVL